MTDEMCSVYELLWQRLLELGWRYEEEYIEMFRVNTIYLYDTESEEVLVTLYDPHIMVDAIYLFMPTANEMVRLLAYPDRIVQVLAAEYLSMWSKSQAFAFAVPANRK